MHVLRDRHT